jgi:hypothetical protein
LASFEEGTSTAVTLVHLEDMIEALEDTTYGPIPASEMVILLARNQLTNISRLSSNLAYNATFGALTTSTDPGTPIDAGRAFRNVSFNGVPIIVVPGFSTTDIVCTAKSNIKIFYHHDIEVISKDTAEFADLYHVVGGANLVVLDPLRAGKLSSKTA